MSVDQADKIDFVTIDKDSGDIWLTISDHLPWCKSEEENHLVVLQNKINSYLSFIESGEIFEKITNAEGRRVVINLVGKFPLSEKAELFFSKARSAVEGVGFRLQFKLTYDQSTSLH